jgi:hypothetical protein
MEAFAQRFSWLAWVRNWIVLVLLKVPLTKTTPSLSSPVCITRGTVLQLACDHHKGFAENSKAD